MLNIKINKVNKSRIDEVDFDNLVFGKEFSDHIFIAEFDGKEWINMRIQPYGPIPLSPSLTSLHYGQSIFEGLKAYKNIFGEIQIFRPSENISRMRESANRMCMEPVPDELFMEGLKAVCKIDSNWIKNTGNSSLYLRPILIASDDYLGIHPSKKYIFMIYGCVVGSYYNEPLKIKVETQYSRAVKGGVGEAKTAGNYASALYATQIAQKEGFHQVLWTDAFEHKYLEELGSSNLFILSGNNLITPAASGTVLKGVTRDSVIELAKSEGYVLQERAVTIDEVFEWHRAGILDELFATGTAANVMLIAELNYKGVSIIIKNKENLVSSHFNKRLDNIKRSKEEDIFGWNEKVPIHEMLPM